MQASTKLCRQANIITDILASVYAEQGQPTMEELAGDVVAAIDSIGLLVTDAEVDQLIREVESRIPFNIEPGKSVL